MQFIEDFKIESFKQRGLRTLWKWTEIAMSRFNISNATTIIKLFYPNNDLMKSFELTNSRSTEYTLNVLKDTNLKLCLNVSFPEVVTTNSVISTKSYETCGSFPTESWPSVHVSLGSSFAAFVVLLLVVSLIFFTQKLGKKRRVMDKKTSLKRKPKESYMYIYPEIKLSKKDKTDSGSLENQDVKCSLGTTGECSTSKMDAESIYDIESLDSISHGEYNGNSEKKDYEIIKCDCGLIHLVGTELECDDFLQKPLYYSQAVPLAPQDTISVETNSS